MKLHSSLFFYMQNLNTNYYMELSPTTQIDDLQPKQEWSKPELTMLSVNQNTLGVNSIGSDVYASHS